MGRWWEAFRLVLLLAIGPALVALGAGHGPREPQVVTKVKPLPGGGSVTIETDPSGITYVTTTDASGSRSIRNATDAEIAAAEPEPPSRTRAGLLAIAALAVSRSWPTGRRSSAWAWRWGSGSGAEAGRSPRASAWSSS